MMIHFYLTPPTTFHSAKSVSFIIFAASNSGGFNCRKEPDKVLPDNNEMVR